MESNIYELTNPQKNIWNTELFYNNTNINNICGTITFLEKINIKVLKKVIDEIIEENDNFHTRIQIKNGKAYQYFEEKIYYDIEIIDTKDEKELNNVETEMLAHVFEMLNSNLFEFKIFKYPNSTGGVIINIHHLIADSWTLGLIATKIAEKYNNIRYRKFQQEKYTHKNKYLFYTKIISKNHKNFSRYFR